MSAFRRALHWSAKSNQHRIFDATVDDGNGEYNMATGALLYDVGGNTAWGSAAVQFA